MATPAYSGVQGNGGTDSEATTIVTGSITTTTGCVLLAAITWFNGSSANVTGLSGGGAGITWTSKIAKTLDTRSNTNIQAYIGTGYTGGVGSVTCTLSVAASWNALSVWEVTNPHATQLDAAAADVADAGTAVDGLLTTTVSDCFVSGYLFNNNGVNTISLPAGMSSINNFDIGLASATHYRTVNPAAGATSVTWTMSGTDEVVNLVMAVAPSAGGAVEYPARSRLFSRAVHRAASY